MHIHVSILIQIPLPSKLPHKIDQNSLCYRVGSCWLPSLNIAECSCWFPNSLITSFSHSSPLATLYKFILYKSMSLFMFHCCCSQEADKVVWYSQLFKNFPVCCDTQSQSILSSQWSSRCFSGIPCFFYGPMDVWNLIYCFFRKPSVSHRGNHWGSSLSYTSKLEWFPRLPGLDSLYGGTPTHPLWELQRTSSKESELLPLQGSCKLLHPCGASGDHV